MKIKNYCVLLAAVIAIISIPNIGHCRDDELSLGKDSHLIQKAFELELNGHLIEAIAQYRLYLKRNIDIIPIYYYLGNLYHRVGYPNRALKAYRETEKIRPS